MDQQIAPTTVTVTSFYIPNPTQVVSAPGSHINNKKFAGLATGAAVGGFALTIVLGWLLFLVWKRRHPRKWQSRAARDQENFPGWRRVVASRLKETDGTSQDTLEIEHDLPSSLSSPPQAPKALLPLDDGRPNYGRRESFSPLLSLPTGPDLLQECTAALQQQLQRPDVSPVSLIGSALPPTSPLTPSLAILLPMEQPHELPANDLASHSSHSSHHTHHTYSSSGHHFASSIGSHRIGRTPSPTHRRNNSHGQIIFSNSSWHGHSSIPRGHASMSSNGSLANMAYKVPPSSWNGHQPLPLLTQPIALQRPIQPNPQPPSSWTGQQPKFFFQEPSVISEHERPPTPPTPEQDPLTLTPPRRLTVTNPDNDHSPAISVLNLQQHEPGHESDSPSALTDKKV